jgi:hypothetical protein
VVKEPPTHWSPCAQPTLYVSAAIVELNLEAVNPALAVTSSCAVLEDGDDMALG